MTCDSEKAASCKVSTQLHLNGLVLRPGSPADSPGKASGAFCRGADDAAGCCSDMAGGMLAGVAAADTAAALLKLKAPPAAHASSASRRLLAVGP